MKKRYILMIAICTILFFLSSCDGSVNEKLFGGSRATTYKVGDTGPAGGIIFYDCDADNNEENDGAGPDKLSSQKDGWRYLEAAPNDLAKPYMFGYYRPSGGANTAVETAFGIGKGKSNTETLVSKMGSGDTGNAYSAVTEGSKIKDDYAAKACDAYSTEVDGVTYDDWFLPTISELDLMYNNLYKHDPALGNFTENRSYWSSNEYSKTQPEYAYPFTFADSHGIGGISKSESRYVRPVRAF